MKRQLKPNLRDRLKSPKSAQKSEQKPTPQSSAPRVKANVFDAYLFSQIEKVNESCVLLDQSQELSLSQKYEDQDQHVRSNVSVPTITNSTKPNDGFMINVQQTLELQSRLKSKIDQISELENLLDVQERKHKEKMQIVLELNEHLRRQVELYETQRYNSSRTSLTPNRSLLNSPQGRKSERVHKIGNLRAMSPSRCSPSNGLKQLRRVDALVQTDLQENPLQSALDHALIKIQALEQAKVQLMDMLQTKSTITFNNYQSTQQNQKSNQLKRPKNLVKPTIDDEIDHIVRELRIKPDIPMIEKIRRIGFVLVEQEKQILQFQKIATLQGRHSRVSSQKMSSTELHAEDSDLKQVQSEMKQLLDTIHRISQNKLSKGLEELLQGNSNRSNSSQIKQIKAITGYLSQHILFEINELKQILQNRSQTDYQNGTFRASPDKQEQLRNQEQLNRNQEQLRLHINHIKQLENAIMEEQMRHQGLRHEIEQIQMEKHEIHLINKKLEKDYQQQAEKLRKLQIEQQDAQKRSELSKSESQGKQQNQLVQELQHQIESDRKEKAQLKKQHDGLIKDIVTLAKEIVPEKQKFKNKGDASQASDSIAIIRDWLKASKHATPLENGNDGNLQEKINQQTNEIKDLQKRVNRLNELERDLLHVSEERQMIQESLDSKQHGLIQVRLQLTELQQRYESQGQESKSQAQRFQAENSGLMQSVEALKDQLNKQRQELEKSHIAENELKRKIADSEKPQAKPIDEDSAKLRDLRDQITKQQSANESLTEQHKLLTLANKNLKSTEQKLQNELAMLGEQLKLAQVTIENFTENEIVLNSRINRLQEQITQSSSKDQSQKLQQQINQLERDSQGLVERMHQSALTSQAEVAKLVQDKQALIQRIDAMKFEQEELKQKSADENKAEMASLVQEKQSLMQRIDVMKHEQEQQIEERLHQSALASQAEVATLVSDNQALMQRIDAMKLEHERQIQEQSQKTGTGNQNEIAELISEKQALIQRIDAMKLEQEHQIESRNQEQAQNLVQIKSNLEELQAQMQELDQVNKQLISQNLEIPPFQARIEDLERELQQSREQVLKNGSGNHELEQQMQDQVNQLKVLHQEELQKLQQNQEQQIKDQTQTHQEEIEQLIQRNEIEINKLRSQISILNDQIKAANDQPKQQEMTKSSVKKSVKMKVDSSDDEKQKPSKEQVKHLKQLTEEIIDQNVVIKTQIMQIGELNKYIQQLEAKIESLEKVEGVMWMEKCNEINELYESLQIQYQQVEQVCDQYSQDLERLQGGVSEGSGHGNAQQAQQIEEYTAFIKNQEQQIAELNAYIQQICQQYAEMQAYTDHQQAEIDQLKEVQSQQAALIEELQGKRH